MTRLDLTVALAISLAVIGCKQDGGERCQTDSDCGDGLVCCPICADDQVYPEGTCESGCADCDPEPGPDAPLPPDLGPDAPLSPDLGPDGLLTPDLGPDA